MKLAQLIEAKELFSGPDMDWVHFFVDAQQKVLTRLNRKYGHPACGRHRCTFSSKAVVIKVPLNQGGVAANSREYQLWKEQVAQGYSDPREIRYSRSRIIYVHDLPLLVMQKLDIARSYEQGPMPDWAGWVDCGQVGKDKRGNWRAYDFA